LTSFLKDFVAKNEDIKRYRIRFDFYKSNYLVINHITDQEIIAELKKYILGWQKEYKQELLRLREYSKTQINAKGKVLKKHHLKQNPLTFFCRLTDWREHRKKYNLLGFHILDNVLEALAARTGISKDLLGYLTFEEISIASRGLISKDELEKRLNDGLLVIFEKDDFKMILGPEAVSLKQELDKRTDVGGMTQGILNGQTACQGYAKGIARIILNEKDFATLKEGEILVTGMTRPEFLPLMKLAAGIVPMKGE
jgi:phosphoenolpyruvate synthase/pyruvate phosphate dikinase